MKGDGWKLMLILILVCVIIVGGGFILYDYFK